MRKTYKKNGLTRIESKRSIDPVIIQIISKNPSVIAFLESKVQLHLDDEFTPADIVENILNLAALNKKKSAKLK